MGILRETRNSRYADAHEATTRALAEAAPRAGLRRIVYLSILGSHAQAANACLASKGRAGQLRPIAEEFEAIVDREQGRLKVELTTAYALADDEARAIVAKIEQSSGRTVEASRSVDPDLIGGMILQAGSLRVDASVRGRLDRLRRELVTRN